MPPAQMSLLAMPVVATNRIPSDGGAGDHEASVVLADFSQTPWRATLHSSAKLLDQTYADYDQQAIGWWPGMTQRPSPRTRSWSYGPPRPQDHGQGARCVAGPTGAGSHPRP